VARRPSRRNAEVRSRSRRRVGAGLRHTLLTEGLAAFSVRQGEVGAVMARRGAGEPVVVVQLAVGVGFSPFSSGSTLTYSSRRPSRWRMR
jgi:hypothetical protein